MKADTTRKVTGRSDDSEKIEWKLSEVNVLDVFRGQKELIGEFKTAAGNVISIEG